MVVVGSGTLTLEELNNGSEMLVVTMNIIMDAQGVLSYWWSYPDEVVVRSDKLTLEE